MSWAHLDGTEGSFGWTGNSPGRRAISLLWFWVSFLSAVLMYFCQCYFCVFLLFVMLPHLLLLGVGQSNSTSSLESYFGPLQGLSNPSQWLGAHYLEGAKAFLIRTWQDFGCLTENLWLIIVVAEEADYHWLGWKENPTASLRCFSWYKFFCDDANLELSLLWYMYVSVLV